MDLKVSVLNFITKKGAVSTKDIVTKTKASSNEVSKALNELLKTKQISVAKRPGKATVWTIKVAKPAKLITVPTVVKKIMKVKKAETAPVVVEKTEVVPAVIEKPTTKLGRKKIQPPASGPDQLLLTDLNDEVFTKLVSKLNVGLIACSLTFPKSERKRFSIVKSRYLALGLKKPGRFKRDFQAQWIKDNGSPEKFRAYIATL
jgi:hypothetical protein